MAIRLILAILLGVGIGLLAVMTIEIAPASRSGDAPYVAVFVGANQGATQKESTPSTASGGNSSATVSVTAGGSTQAQNRNEAALGSQGVPSLLANIGRQPAGQSAVLSLPIIAAILFGIVLYRTASQRQSDGDSVQM